MIKYLWVLPCVLLAIPVLCAGQDVQPKPVSKRESYLLRKSSTFPKSTNSAPKPVEQSAKSAYAELTIGELIAEDANRWSGKCLRMLRSVGSSLRWQKGTTATLTSAFAETPK